MLSSLGPDNLNKIAQFPALQSVFKNINNAFFVLGDFKLFFFYYFILGRVFLLLFGWFFLFCFLFYKEKIWIQHIQVSAFFAGAF